MGTPTFAAGAGPHATMDGQAVAAALETLNERVASIAAFVDTLRPIAELLHQAPALAATLGDAFDDVMRTTMASGIDVERGLINGAGAALRFGATMDAGKVRELEALLHSGVLDPAALRVVGELAGALVLTASAPARQAGPVALLKALGDPNVRRALGFLVAFAERFGSRLEPQPAQP